MDYLYVVQQLCESRKIMISNAMGSITFVVWAHYVPGLNVLITTEVPSTIALGDEQNLHVLIVWSKLTPHAASLYPVSSKDRYKLQPSMQLLDEEVCVILDSALDSERWRDIAVNTRYPLLGYGATYLHRMFNADIITYDLESYLSGITKTDHSPSDLGFKAGGSWHERYSFSNRGCQSSITAEKGVNWYMEDTSFGRVTISQHSWGCRYFRYRSVCWNVSRGPLDEASLPTTCTVFLQRVPIKPVKLAQGNDTYFIFGV